MKQGRVQCVIMMGGVGLRGRVYVIIIYIRYSQGRGVGVLVLFTCELFTGE